MSETNEQPAGERKQRTVTGRVISSKMDKTVSVAVERLVKHPVYGKYLRRTSRFLAHDEGNECREGDLVSVAECRPLSRRKTWRVVDIVERADERG